MRCFTSPSFEDKEDGHPGNGQNQMVLQRDVSYDVVEDLSVWFCTAGSTSNSG